MRLRIINLTFVCALALCVVAARPFGPFWGGTSAGISPFTDRYMTGTGIETVPSGSVQLIVEVWAGGAGGAAAHTGGSSGSYGTRTFTVNSSDWNKPISWAVGNGGAGCLGTSCIGANGVSSTVGGISLTIGGTTLNISTNPGLASGFAPTAGTGGSTNTAGNAQSSGTGGVAINGMDSDKAGGGGDSGFWAPTDPPVQSVSGVNGMVKFKFY